MAEHIDLAVNLTKSLQIAAADLEHQLRVRQPEVGRLFLRRCGRIRRFLCAGAARGQKDCKSESNTCFFQHNYVSFSFGYALCNVTLSNDMIRYSLLKCQ